jgi:hypothetical protein
LSIDSAEKHAVIFGAASMEEARVKRQAAEKYDASTVDDVWTNNDVEYDIGLTKVVVDVDPLPLPYDNLDGNHIL